MIETVIGLGDMGLRTIVVAQCPAMDFLHRLWIRLVCILALEAAHPGSCLPDSVVRRALWDRIAGFALPLWVEMLSSRPQ